MNIRGWVVQGRIQPDLNVKPRAMEVCCMCTIDKAKQKNEVHFILDEKIQVPGERNFIDILSM